MPVATMPPPVPSTPPDPPRQTARFAPPDRIDLRAAWARERDLASAPGARHDAGDHGRTCPGRHGWLLDDGLDVLLEPALGANTAPGYYGFAALDERIAAGLLERLDEQTLATERQNLGPTLGTVLRAVVRRPDRVRAQGYVVGPLRCDERVSVTGALVRTDRPLRLDRLAGRGDDELMDLLTGLGIDDMQAPPDEVTPWWGSPEAVGAAAGDRWYRVWWD
ncbi:hypothetical protein M1843_11845 [Isoptericola sp. 4D.3]|uniref:Uncharacterized protein n=1 Tax=Isoptericola peretonis TaxID=2918523 RepID=A0ABT0J4K1_9MICO|nr:hypothetical protein [Isoptericola sp. 4D.3]